MDAPARARRLRAPAAGDHRPDAGRPPADARRRRPLDHVQRRGLQLPGAAARARRPLPHRLRHRGRDARPRPLGRGLARPPARHVRLRAVGRGRAGAGVRARPVRDQALLLRPGRRRPVLRLRGEGAAAVPAEDRDRPPGAQGLPRVPVLPRRQDAVRGRQRAAARPPPARAQRHRGARAVLGGLLRPRLRPHGEVLRGADRGAAGGVGAAAPAQRRAGRRLPQRRPGLVERRVARQPPARAGG